MSDPVTREGLMAQHVLDDEIFQSSVLELEKNTITQWRSAKTVEERERAHADLMALGRVVGKLRMLVERAAFEKARQEKDKPQ